MPEAGSPFDTPGDARDAPGAAEPSPKRARIDSDYEHRPRADSVDADSSHEDGDRPEPSPKPGPVTTEPSLSAARSKLDYRPHLILRGHKKGVAAVKFSPDGRHIASCSADATIKIWEARTGKHQQTLQGHLAGISTIAWSPDSKTLASGSDDKSIRLWDVATGKAYPVPLLGHHNYIYSIAFSPNGNMLVSGSYDEAVFIWDVRTARVMRSLPAHSDPVGGVDFVRDGSLVASCASDGLMWVESLVSMRPLTNRRIWDTATGQCLRTLVHEDNAAVTAVRFSPNGRYVLAWTLDSCVRLWNYVEGRCVKTYQGHRNQRYSVSGAFGTYVRGDREAAFAATGSEDGRVVVWDVASKAVLQSFQAHEAGSVVLGVDTCGAVSSAGGEGGGGGEQMEGGREDDAVGDTGDAVVGGRAGEEMQRMKRMMATCGMDGTVRVWRSAG